MNQEDFKKEIQRRLLELEDKEGNPRRPDYDSVFWKGARYTLHDLLIFLNDYKPFEPIQRFHREYKEGKKKNGSV
jgi:hypothetical protein